jgi:alcohol dehydrogenase (cytochrome c)
MIALDSRTGEVIWDHEMLSTDDTSVGVQLSGVPIVVKGKVIMGISLCIARRGGCYIVALDAETGDEVWRFNTLARPGQPGGDSWNGLPVKQRFGGAIWTGGSYDPDLDLLYFGVGNTYITSSLLIPQAPAGPSNAGAYTEATVAIDSDSGELAWYYQHMIRDVWDMDWAFEQTLIDMPIDGVTRKLVVTGGKLAIFDAVDRADGHYVFSRDVGLQNLVIAIDADTGDKMINPEFRPEPNVTKLICPAAGGIRNWPATSYNPHTHVLYVPINDGCADFTWTPRDAAQRAAGGIDQRFLMRPRPQNNGLFGGVQAINLHTGETVWKKMRRAPNSSAILATAGGLVFNGARDRYFRAYDQDDGEELWRFRLDMVASSAPITHSVDGEQYVAVVTGGGNPQDNHYVALTPEIVNPTGAITLWVFKLGTKSDHN